MVIAVRAVSEESREVGFVRHDYVLCVLCEVVDQRWLQKPLGAKEKEESGERHRISRGISGCCISQGKDSPRRGHGNYVRRASASSTTANLRAAWYLSAVSKGGVGTGGHRENQLSCAAQCARVASYRLPRTALGDGSRVGGTLISGTDIRCSREGVSGHGDREW